MGLESCLIAHQEKSLSAWGTMNTGEPIHANTETQE